MIDLLTQAKQTPTIHNDGGRAANGWKGSTGDCVLRAAVIAMTSGAAEDSDLAKAAYKVVRETLIDIAAKERDRRFRFLTRKELRVGHLPRGQAKELARLRKAPRRSVFNGVYKREWNKFCKEAGIVKVTMPPGPRPTVAEVAAEHDRAIVSISKHHTAVANGAVQDIWSDLDRLLVYEWEGVPTPLKARGVWLPTEATDRWLAARL